MQIYATREHHVLKNFISGMSMQLLQTEDSECDGMFIVFFSLLFERSTDSYWKKEVTDTVEYKRYIY